MEGFLGFIAGITLVIAFFLIGVCFYALNKPDKLVSRSVPKYAIYLGGGCAGAIGVYLLYSGLILVSELLRVGPTAR